jgi:hypothetical protein
MFVTKEYLNTIFHYGFCVDFNLSSPEDRLKELEKIMINNNYSVKIKKSDL